MSPIGAGDAAAVLVVAAQINSSHDLKGMNDVRRPDGGAVEPNQTGGGESSKSASLGVARGRNGQRPEGILGSPESSSYIPMAELE